MAHKTLVGGTAYSISGGKTLIDGTAYSIKNGKTLVGGTAYEVGFAPAGATVTIIGNGGNYANVVIDGVTYNTAAEVVVPIGTAITCSVKSDNDASPGIIMRNFEQVACGVPSAQHEYTVVSDVTIALGQADPSAVGQAVGGHISIVDESAPPYATVTITRNFRQPYQPSVTVNGLAYKVPTIVHAPIGSAVSCSPLNNGTVFVNGEAVATTTHEYILGSNVGIELKTTIRGSVSPTTVTGDIYITEL